MAARQDGLISENIVIQSIGGIKSGKEGNVEIRFRDKYDGGKYKNAMEVIVALIKNKKPFSDFEVDYSESNLNKFDVSISKEEIKSGDKDPRQGMQLCLYEPQKLSEGPDKNDKKLLKYNLTKEEYNKGCEEYSKLLNQFEIEKEIRIQKLLYLNKKSGDIFEIDEFEILPSVTTGIVKRVVNNLIITGTPKFHSKTKKVSAVERDILISKLLKDDTPNKKSRKIFDYKNEIEICIEKFNHISNLYKHFIETNILCEYDKLSNFIKRENAYSEIDIDNKKLYFSTKDSVKDMRRRLKNLETSVVTREIEDYLSTMV